METMNVLNMEQMNQISGGVLTENDTRYIRALICKAKRDPDIYDAICFLNTDGEYMTEEQMNYVLEVWDYIH